MPPAPPPIPSSLVSEPPVGLDRLGLDRLGLTAFPSMSTSPSPSSLPRWRLAATGAEQRAFSQVGPLLNREIKPGGQGRWPRQTRERDTHEPLLMRTPVLAQTAAGVAMPRMYQARHAGTQKPTSSKDWKTGTGACAFNTTPRITSSH